MTRRIEQPKWVFDARAPKEMSATMGPLPRLNMLSGRRGRENKALMVKMR